MNEDNIQGLDEILKKHASYYRTDDDGLEFMPTTTAEQAILQWVKDVVIGEDEDWRFTRTAEHQQRVIGKNALRSEQRRIIDNINQKEVI